MGSERQDFLAFEAARWRHVADVLYAELCKWGWGDFHYGHQNEQEPKVRAALKTYEKALENDGPREDS